MRNPYSKLDDTTVQAFADLMIQKMEALTINWERPWIDTKIKGKPQNLNGRRYSYSNAFFLYLLCELKHYETPVYLTFPQARENGLLINKGARSFPVVYFDFLVRDRLSGEKITIDEYEQLPEEEKANYKVIPFTRQHPVFNIEQTNIKEARPELWDELSRKFTVDIPLDTQGMASCVPLDILVERQKWLCPIYPERSDDAYFTPDEIHIPLKSRFKDGESYYSTLLHEMTHSTGLEGRLDRPIANLQDTEEYGREELIAELTAALISAYMGITTIPQEENVAYLKGWCEEIKRDPRYILTILSEVTKASAMITSLTDRLEMTINMENERTEIQRPKKIYTSGKGEQLELSFVEPVSCKEGLGDRLLRPGLMNLQEGEFCKVERLFDESRSFSFTSGERIETMEDVAYIFKRLEDLAVENAFAVLVKDGVPVVLHLGMGSYASAPVCETAIMVAADRLSPDSIYFVHNHPSGQLRASQKDIQVWTSLKKTLGDKLMPGIIINLRSGHFGLFTEEALPMKEMKNGIMRDIPLKLYSFSKQVFRPDYNPEENTTVRCSADIASLISSQRLGDRKKINVLILNGARGVVANLFTPFTSIRAEDVDKVAKRIINMIALAGGIAAVAYGDFTIDKVQQDLARKIKEYTGGEFSLLDTIAMRGNYSSYISAADENLLGEEKTEYQSRRELTRHNSTQIEMEQNVKKVDLSKVDWEALKTRFGITREALEEKGVLNDMTYLKKSGQLLMVTYEGATGTKEFEARLQFRETEGGYTLKFYPVRETPELDKPYLGYEFTEEDKMTLRQTGHLGKVVEVQPYNSPKKEGFISLDPLTNDIVHVDKDRISLRDTFCKVALTESQKADIMSGQAVYVKDMESLAGKRFDAFLRIDANKKGLAITHAPKVEIDIDKVTGIHGVMITEEQREILKNGGAVSLENMRTSEGKVFSAEVSFSQESKSLKFNFPGLERMLSVEQKSAIDRGEKVLMTDLMSKGGISYDMLFFKNKETGRIEREFPVKDTVMGVKLTTEQMKDLQEGRYVWIDELRRKDGSTFKAPVIWDAKKGKFAFAERKERVRDYMTPQLKENEREETRTEENVTRRGRRI